MTNTSLVQLYPSRITVTQRPSKKQFFEMDFNYQAKKKFDLRSVQWSKNFAKKKNSFTLSASSKKKLLDSVNSMHMLSNPRKITMKTGKFIYNYQLSFVTLTLPSKQEHSDRTIKSECLNQFLVELRKYYDVNNYVWKAELQQKGNIHFHLILDKYVDYQALRRRWNRCVNKLGYVLKYQEKMSQMSLQEYHALRSRSAKISFADSAKAYAKGKKHKWTRPNSVDVKSVNSKKDLAIYLAKYITKKSAKVDDNGAMDMREREFGRSWSRSYSLAQLKYQNKFTFFQVAHILKYLESVPKIVKHIKNMYYEVYYFNFNRLCEAYKAFHLKFIFANAKMYNYPFP